MQEKYKNLFSLFTYFTEEGKVIQENSLFYFFLAAHYVGKTYTSKYFLLWAEVFFKDVCCGCQWAVSKELAVSKESSLLPVHLSLVSL